METELNDHRKSILGQLALFERQYEVTKDDKWLDRQIALQQTLAAIDNSLVLEHGLHKLWALLKTNLINDTVDEILGS
jgi:hypothetical protein